MKAELTAVIKKVNEGYIGYVRELTGANTQGVTVDEVKVNLAEAIALVTDANNLLSERET